MIYFIQDTRDSRVKIGFSKDPWARLRDLKCGAPDSLVLLAVADGDQKEERAAHARFGEHRVAREWFRAAPELLAFIEECRSRYPQERPAPTPADDTAIKAQVERDLAAYRERAKDPWFLANIQRGFMDKLRRKGIEPGPEEHRRLEFWTAQARAVEQERAEIAAVRARIEKLERLLDERDRVRAAAG